MCPRDPDDFSQLPEDEENSDSYLDALYGDQDDQGSDEDLDDPPVKDVDELDELEEEES